MNDLEKQLESLNAEISVTWNKLDLDTKLARITEIEALVAQPNLWADQDRARKVTTELKNLQDETDAWQILRTQATDLKELILLADSDLQDEIKIQLDTLKSQLDTLKKALRFTGPHDHRPAILRITAGVGGTEAMDWAGMLERMYQRFCDRNNYSMTLIERQQGEEAGIKTAVYELDGKDTYGTFKSEHGVHRLVRLSPFNADNLRQTSFALVEILPVLEAEDVEIDEKDLRIDVYHSGGHGGQGVNTTDSAVRITHLPTGTVVAIQNERSQHQNKDKAMEILRGKLAQMQQEQQAENLKDLRAGESAKWGQQIRNYVLQPYKLVKDTRTKHEETDADAVLDGKIEPFIDAYLDQ